MSSTGNGVSVATNAIGLGGSASSLDTDSRAGAPTSQVIHDIGDSLDKAQSYLNSLQTVVNNSTDATGNVVGQSAQISADMQLAQQAQQQYLTDTDSPLQSINPDAYQAQLNADLNSIRDAEGDMLMQGGMILTESGAPQEGLLLAFAGFLLKSKSLKEVVADVGQLLGQVAAMSDDNNDDPPSFGARQIANDDYGNSLLRSSPLVLDLSGNGINLTELSSSSPYFDLTNDGFARQTGWVGQGTGILCFDPTDSNITNITQLFGNSTTDGFNVLRLLDSNGDGVIDSSDPAYASLRIWVDANGNAKTDPGELYTLAQLGIVSINLNYTPVNETIAGNAISSISSFTMADGTTHEIADAWFTNNPTNTEPDEQVTASTLAESMPQLQGAGTMRDLRSAMTLDPTLLGLVQAFTSLPSSTDPTQLENDFQAILFRWAGVEEVNPWSRGGYIDARRLEFVEQYLGQDFDSANDGTMPGFRASSDAQRAWNDLFDSSLACFVLQTSLASTYAPEFTYDASNDIVTGEFLPQALSDALRRMGAPSMQNLSQWDIFLRVADAYRMDAGLTAAEYESIVDIAAGDSVASIAHAIASGLVVTIDANGIREIGSAVGDTFYAGQGISTLVGNGGGNNFAVQLASNDCFVYSAGDGSVEINEIDTIAVAPTNTLTFMGGIQASDVKVSADAAGDVVLTLSTGDTIKIDLLVNSVGNGVQSITFADGTSWSRAQILSMCSQGTSGSDYLFGTSGADLLDGHGGDDYAQGNGGNDTFIFDAGYGRLEIDEIDLASSLDNTLEMGGGLTASAIRVRGDSHGDLIISTVTAGDQIVLDGMLSNVADGIQEIVFTDGTTLDRAQLLQLATTGTAGSDTLYGSVGADLIDGGGGNDVVVGGGGNDTFVFNAGYGQLEIDEQDFANSAANVLQLGSGISAATVVVSYSGSDVVLTDGISGDRIQIDGMLEWKYDGVQQIRFADGTTLSAAQVDALACTFIGTTGNDTLNGTPEADYFDGKGGNDSEHGDGGNDTFVFNAGYGDLEVAGGYVIGQVPVLQLGAGISESSLHVRATSDGTGLVVTDGIAGDQITLDNMLKTGSYGYGVALVQFADGTTLTESQVVTLETTGTTGNDTLYGTAGADVFDGKGGSDIEYGDGGNDTFVFNGGYGDLEIAGGYAIGQLPVLQLGAGIGESSLHVNATTDGTGLIITDGIAGDQITLDNMLKTGSYGYGVALVKFADGTTLTESQVVALETTGTTGNDTLYGTTGAEVFDGRGGNDIEYGAEGNDTFVFGTGYGSLEISESFEAGQFPVLELGMGFSESSLHVDATSDGTGLVITDGIAGDQITLDNMLKTGSNGYGVALIEFADGTTLTESQAVALETTGTIGNDTLYGTTGAEVFDGKGGSDIEHGGGGDDTFIFAAGYGSLEISESFAVGQLPVLKFGAGIGEASLHVSATGSGTGVVITDGIAGDEIILDNMLNTGEYGVTSIVFADGTTLSATQIDAVARTFTGTSGNDTLSGTTGGDYFDGAGGRDLEQGDGGSDTFVYNAGYGNLEISEGYTAGQQPVLDLGAGISEASLHVSATSDGTGVVIADGVAGDQITLDNMLNTDRVDYGVASIEFADGTTLSAAQVSALARTFIGTSGNDTLNGTTGADYFDGKGGNDSEHGDGGNDTFVFNAGYGHLEIAGGYVIGQQPVLELGAGISAASLHMSVTSDGTGVVITDGIAGDQITLDNMLKTGSYGYGVASIAFSDGTTLSAAQVNALACTFIGTSGNDTLNGTTAADYFDGKGGNDSEHGDGGSDTFVFNAGYGDLEIAGGYAIGQLPVLQLGAGISESSLHVSATSDGTGLVMTDGIVGDQITLDNMLKTGSYGYGVALVKFADGTTLTESQVVALETTGTTGNDTLYGTTGAEVFDGKGGNDVEHGAGGNDTFVFGAGYGFLEISESIAVGQLPVLELGAGISESSLRVSTTSDGTGLIITDGIAGDQITLDNMLNTGGYGVTSVEFADGTTLSAAQVNALARTISGTSGNDTLNGTTGANYFDGKGGSDYEHGDGGNDTFVFNVGYGHLEISETYTTGQQPVLDLGAGISEASLHVSATSDGTGVVISDGIAGDQITLDSMLNNGGYGVTSVEFSDGTTLSAAQVSALARTFIGTSGNDTLNGTTGADYFDGKGGNDSEHGDGGNDTFVFNAGYGHLEIAGGYVIGQQPVLELGAGISAASLHMSATSDGTGVVITDGIAGDQITLDNMLKTGSYGYGVASIAFSDGTTLSAAQVNALACTFIGTSGNDTLNGTPGSDYFDGKGGNDSEHGDGGSDTFVFNAGYGELEIAGGYAIGQLPVLQFGAGISESSLHVRATSDGTGLVMTDGIVGDQITLDNMLKTGSYGYGVALVKFADGTTLTEAQVVALETTGTTGNDTLYGTTGAEVFDGKGGNDFEYGDGGNDKYVLGLNYGGLTIQNGTTSSNTAAGDLSIVGVNSNNLWLERVGNNLQVDIMGTSTEATIANWYSNTYSQLSELTVTGGSGGNMALTTQISQLVQAMATFSAANPGFDPTQAANSQITDPTVLAAVSSAWHQAS